MFRIFVVLICCCATTVTAQTNARPLAEAFKEIWQKDWSSAVSLAGQEGQIGTDIVLWHAVRDGAGTYKIAQDFMARNSDWPGMPRFISKAEALFTDAPRAVVLSHFAQYPPTTAEGRLTYARALRAAGQTGQAQLVVQNAWLTNSMPRPVFEAYLAEFEQDIRRFHNDRLVMALWKDWTDTANMILPYADATLQQIAQVRLALRSNQADADERLKALSPKAQDDPLISHARFLWRLDNGYRESAVAFLEELSASPVKLGDPDKWASWRLRLAREAMLDGDAKRAYALASQHHLVSGSTYAQLEWLAGFIALRKLQDPKTALMHFEKFLFAVETPISLGRGNYWLAITYELLGRQEQAMVAFQNAAEHQTSFYGQLAAERIGTKFTPEYYDWSDLPDWRDADFVNGSVFKAAILLFAAGQDALGERFLTHLAETLPDDQILQLTDFLEEYRRPHVLVMVGKRVAGQGRNFPRPYFALHPLINTRLPIAPEMALAIARRESEFDPSVKSRVGAMGLMQVMPKTAEAMADKLGLAYDERRVLRDWEYNAALGAAYLAQVAERFGGNPILIAIAYNAGPSRVKQWIERNGDPRSPTVDLVDWIEHIPFSETRNYVMRVTESLPVYRARLNATPQQEKFTDLLRGSGFLPLSP